MTELRKKLWNYEFKIRKLGEEFWFLGVKLEFRKGRHKFDIKKVTSLIKINRNIRKKEKDKEETLNLKSERTKNWIFLEEKG